MLEASLKSDNAFVSLTYSDPNLPLSSDGFPTLDPKHLQDWLKRFRKAIQPLRVRFYAVGEYGESRQRPHYHLFIFGYPKCVRGRTFYRASTGRPVCCSHCETIHDTWGLGRIDVGDCTAESAQYVAGYVTKKMTSKSDDRLKGRHPEFARMSNRPGLGHDFMWEIAATLLNFNLESKQGDVPSSLRHGKKLLPLGRYLRRRLRTMIGRDEKTPDDVLQEIEETLRPMWEAANTTASSKELREVYYKNLVLEEGDQRVAQMEARQRIFKKRDTI